MGRFERSLALVQASFAVLKENPQLAWFPIVSSIFTIGLTISFMLPLYFAAGPEALKTPEHLPVTYYIVLAVFYLCSYFTIIFFNAGLVSCAYASLCDGRKMTFGDGIREAAKRLPAIFSWAVLAATVGLILQFVSERSGIIGKIVVALVGGAWNLVTFFVVPIIVVEQGSPIAAVKKSGSILKRTWGESLIGNAGMGLVFMLLSFIPVMFIVAACFTGSVIAIVSAVGIAVLCWLVLATISASLNGIYRTALYLYAESGTVAAWYNKEAFEGAFRQGKPNLITRMRNR